MATVITCAVSFTSRCSLDKEVLDVISSVNKFDKVVGPSVVAACTVKTANY